MTRTCFTLLLLCALAVPARAESVELDAVAAVVNQEVVLASQLRRTASRHPLMQEAMSQVPASATPRQREQKLREAEGKILDELIDLVLLREQARKYDIQVSDQDVQDALASIAKQYGRTVPQLKVDVERSGQYGTWDEYRQEVRDQILQLKVTHMLASWSVSDAQVREHYRKLVREEGAKLKVNELLFRPAGTESGEKDRAFTSAQAAARMLREGASLQAAAEQMQASRNEARVLAQGELAPAQERAVFGAKVGEVVGPVPTGAGYVVFQVAEQLEGAALSFEAVEDRIRNQLSQEAAVRADAEMRQQLRARAHIDVRL